VTKFIYNPKTCRYEREGFSFWRASLFAVLMIIVSSITFAGIAALHALISKSDAEIAMRAENNALEKHYAIVKNQYVESSAQLSALEKKDKTLKTALFNNIFSETEPSTPKTESYIDITSLSKLRKSIQILSDRTDDLKADAYFNSHYFGEKLSDQREVTLNKLMSMPSILPVSNGKLISGFGKRIHPFHKGLYKHEGIDIAAARGTEVVATADGVVNDVTHSNLLAGYGNSVELTHNAEIDTRYAHLETILVKQGQRVKKGQVIGTVGNSGGSIAPHLHYEVLRKGKEQNPMHYLLQNIHPETYQELFMISKKQNQSLD
jgi:murein DD-endopeptidase MepM/ murein hydrolase activator NlpD